MHTHTDIYIYRLYCIVYDVFFAHYCPLHSAARNPTSLMSLTSLTSLTSDNSATGFCAFSCE